jgi:Ca2+-binding EF-hand superfamily protein
VRKVLSKQKADRKKQELKRLMKKIDRERRGYISSEVFFQLLSMEGILLGQPAINKLKRECRPVAGGISTVDSIMFREAL